jgi:hypothetical protein
MSDIRAVNEDIFVKQGVGMTSPLAPACQAGKIKNRAGALAAPFTQQLLMEMADQMTMDDSIAQGD